jgi:hypothetical protein
MKKKGYEKVYIHFLGRGDLHSLPLLWPQPMCRQPVRSLHVEGQAWTVVGGGSGSMHVLRALLAQTRGGGDPDRKGFRGSGG